MRVRTLTTLFFAIGIFSFSAQAHAETVTMYSQLDDSGEMVSQQATFQNTWITSASLGNLVLGKDRLSITFTIKDPNASNEYHQPEGVALGTCATCQNLQKYYFTNADRTLLADREFHTFTVQTGTTTIGLADGTTPIYITFFGLSQYHNSTHVKSDVAGTIPYLIIEGTPPPPAVIPEAPPGSVTVYTQSDNTGVMTNPQATFQNAHIDSVSLGNLNVGQGKLYLTFTIKDPSANNVYRQPEGVALGTCFGCRNLQTYRFTDADRTLLSDQAFHTFLVETGTTTSTYADGTRPVFISFFNLSQYQYGTKVKSNAAATIPFLSIQTAPPPDPCALPGACASNVLFLPGIEASRLYRPDYAGGTDQLWEPTSNTDVLDLFMTASGTSTRSDIYTKDVMDEAYGTFNIYKSFLADLDAWKNTDRIIADYSAVPYDWRLSLDDVLDYGRQMPDGRLYYSGDLRATSTPYVIQELRRLAAASKTGKVTIVAHSNGGLVAKALLKRLQDTHDPLLDKVDAVIMVAVPQAGTPNALGAVLHGYNQGIPKDWAGFFLSPQVAREAVQNMPSAYSLLPSFQYFTYTDDNVVTFDDSPLLAPWRAKYGDKIHSSERLRNFLTDQSRPALPTAEAIKNPIVGNAALLANAETLHNTALDNWTPPSGVRIIEIAGWGEDTVKTIHYYQGTTGTCSERRSNSTCAAIVQTPVLDYKPEMVIDGDGTVVVPSALWTTGTERYWVNLKSHNAFGQFRVNREHADIFEVESLRGFIQNIITNVGTSSLPQFISSIQPVGEERDARLRFTLHSPLTLDLYDNLGNHTGISTSTGSLEEKIPGSRYERLGGVTYVSAPASTTIRLTARGYAEGSFTLDVEETQGNITTASTTFAGIPSGTTTIATLTIPQDGGIASSSPLTVDENGDGHIDLILVPKEGNSVMPDITPPEAVFAFATTTDDVTVSGRDDGAVSVSPSTILSTSTLHYTITDDSGNTTSLSFKRIKEKESKNERNGHIKAQLLSIRYGTLSTTTESVLPKNEIQYEWERSKDGSLKELEQNVKVRKDFTFRAKYNAKKNETKIYFVDKENKEKLKETKLGLVLVRIATKGGELTVEY